MFPRRRFAGYIRVSSANDDADIEAGINAQKELIKRYAEEGGSGVLWYIDDGGGDALPALQALLADAASPDCGFDTVLVPNCSRVSRNIVEFQATLSELRKNGVALASVMEPLEATPAGRLVGGIIQALDDFQRDIHSEDTRRGIEAARLRREGC